MKNFHWRDFAPVFGVIACALIVCLLLATGIINLDTLPLLVADRPWLALLIIFALFVIKGFSGAIVYNALIVAVALIFPLPAALLINAVGTLITLTISYQIGARTKTQSIDLVLEKHPKMQKYFRKTRQYGFVSCFAIHMLGLSMEVLGILFGMMHIGFWQYLISSWLAIMPGMVCFVILGNDLDFHSPVFWAVLAVDAILIAFGFFYTKKTILNDTPPEDSTPESSQEE